MRDPYIIIERPILTEKSNGQASMNKYHFKVRKDANKIEIAHAVEHIFGQDGVKVLAVNTISVKGKKRRAQVKNGRGGYTPDWKKAIVTTDLPIVLFEGV